MATVFETIQDTVSKAFYKNGEVNGAGSLIAAGLAIAGAILGNFIIPNGAGLALGGLLLGALGVAVGANLNSGGVPPIAEMTPSTITKAGKVVAAKSNSVVLSESGLGSSKDNAAANAVYINNQVLTSTIQAVDSKLTTLSPELHDTIKQRVSSAGKVPREAVEDQLTAFDALAEKIQINNISDRITGNYVSADKNISSMPNAIFFEKAEKAINERRSEILRDLDDLQKEKDQRGLLTNSLTNDNEFVYREIDRGLAALKRPRTESRNEMDKIVYGLASEKNEIADQGGYLLRSLPFSGMYNDRIAHPVRHFKALFSENLPASSTNGLISYALTNDFNVPDYARNSAALFVELNELTKLQDSVSSAKANCAEACLAEIKNENSELNLALNEKIKSKAKDTSAAKETQMAEAPASAAESEPSRNPEDLQAALKSSEGKQYASSLSAPLMAAVKSGIDAPHV